MSALFIIGNGFDLFNDLDTRYADFHKFISENYKDLEDDIEEYFSFSVDDKYLWKDFENDLATFNYRNLFDAYNHIDIMSESFSPSEAFGLEDDIKENVDHFINKMKAAFTDWIEEVQYPSAKSNKLVFPENARFINFNYTDTLALLYRISKKDILYIHNNAHDLNGELIFGHGKLEENEPAIEELDKDGNSNRTIFTDSENAARYPFYAFMKNSHEILNDNKEYFAGLKNITEITVLGHSLGRPDLIYFRELKNLFPNAIWSISYYGESQEAHLRDIAKDEIGIEERNLKMITIEMIEND
ncbi:bacteriophage abortive infection AbiH family protein [Sphingobacterium sp. InxBP1]|uniref:bacteriophage abortive infection AbiH family protein n=1 Tax=Sphingobacterium sp. InxBP1 TaxID=2870328 RepID=UPI00224362CC|nr:bacteriophage abortive infection AbiH family protein [Sphingobacterium sp. InxBP1]MCW8313501.1 bacteriophage abortive infection AbiH family protein [Sphingobacterium sp. InxBP1]